MREQFKVHSVKKRRRIRLITEICQWFYVIMSIALILTWGINDLDLEFISEGFKSGSFITVLFYVIIYFIVVVVFYLIVYGGSRIVKKIVYKLFKYE